MKSEIAVNHYHLSLSVINLLLSDEHLQSKRVKCELLITGLINVRRITENVFGIMAATVLDIS